MRPTAALEPLVGQEFVESCGGIGAHAAEDVGEAGNGLDAACFARRCEGGEAGDVIASFLMVDEKEVLS